jgi:hypothetical protein
MSEPERTHEERSEFIRGPRWRVEASPSRLRTASLITFAIVFVVGLLAMSLAMVVLGVVGASGWLVLAPWWLPTLGVLVWTVLRARPAVAADDDEAWITYAVKFVLVGPNEPRPTPVRVIVAVLVGGPTAWALMVVWILALLGLGDA